MGQLSNIIHANKENLNLSDKYIYQNKINIEGVFNKKIDFNHYVQLKCLLIGDLI